MVMELVVPMTPDPCLRHSLTPYAIKTPKISRFPGTP